MSDELLPEGEPGNDRDKRGRKLFNKARGNGGASAPPTENDGRIDNNSASSEPVPTFRLVEDVGHSDLTNVVEPAENRWREIVHSGHVRHRAHNPVAAAASPISRELPMPPPAPSANA
jgi:hypothetical protein